MTTDRVAVLSRLIDDPETPASIVIDACAEIANIALARFVGEADEPPLRDQIAALEAQLAATEAATARRSALR